MHKIMAFSLISVARSINQYFFQHVRVARFIKPMLFFLNSVASLRAAEGFLIIDPTEYCPFAHRIRGQAVAGRLLRLAFCKTNGIATIRGSHPPGTGY